MLITGPRHGRRGDGLALANGRRLAVVLALVASAFLLTLLASPGATAEHEPAAPWVFTSQWGWYHGERIEYYDLGRATNTTAPAYRLVDPGGDPIDGQRLIFGDLRPGVLVGAETGQNYSDFHRIWDVTVPDGYSPDQLRSLNELMVANLTMVETELVWNTPMVPAGSSLVGADSGAHPLQEGWWDGESVHYFRFETSSEVPGLFDSGTDRVRDVAALAVFDPPGQLDILDTYPGDATYSPLTRLFIFNPISTEFVADSVRSRQEAEALGFLLFPEGNLYNRPIVGGREAIARYEQGDRSTFSLLEAWWSETSKVLYYDLGPLSGKPAPIYRFVTEEGSPIVAQHMLVDVVAPGVLQGPVESDGYCPIWRVHEVVVVDETAFQPDVIKSLADVHDLGWTINVTDEYMVAPMVTREPLFLPAPSNPPGEGLVRAWYRGADVHLVHLAYIRPENLTEVDGGQVVPTATTNLTVLVDELGQPLSGQRPILGSIPGEEGYTPVWSVVHASGGDGFRPDRFRTHEQLEARGWGLEPSGDWRLGGFVAGPVNTPAWKPQRFTFVVGPVRDQDGGAVRGAVVRVSRGIEVVQGTTDPEGLVSFEVNSTWNDQVVQVFVSKAGYEAFNFPAEIHGYERFEPSGGYVPEMVRVDDDGGLGASAAYAVVGLLVLAGVVLLLLGRGRKGRHPTLTEEEVDEIFAGEGPDEHEGKELRD